MDYNNAVIVISIVYIPGMCCWLVGRYSITIGCEHEKELEERSCGWLD